MFIEKKKKMMRKRRKGENIRKLVKKSHKLAKRKPPRK
jgi:hypothetical protein